MANTKTTAKSTKKVEEVKIVDGVNVINESNRER